jgi:putative transposase
MLLAHQIELKPNNKQSTHFAKACGVARFAYNWALDQWKKQYEDGGKPSETVLRKQLNSIKKSEYPWMLEGSFPFLVGQIPSIL